jgi:hypothetical protein
MARGTIEVMRPHPEGGARPITPKNGCSGSSTPHGRVPTRRSLSSGMITQRGSWKSSGSAPASGRMML